MKDCCEIVVLMDKSGSMADTANDAIGGFNTFLKYQQDLPGEAKLTLVLFDTIYRTLYESTPIKEVKPLTNKEYFASGMTALLDAFGNTVTNLGNRLENLPESERPNKVIVCVVTDGEENSSHEYKKDQIKSMAEHQRSKYNWEFVYLGANQDAFAEGNSFGIYNTTNYVGTKGGTYAVYSSSLNNSVRSFRNTGKVDINDDTTSN